MHMYWCQLPGGLEKEAPLGSKAESGPGCLMSGTAAVVVTLQDTMHLPVTNVEERRPRGTSAVHVLVQDSNGQGRYQLGWSGFRRTQHEVHWGLFNNYINLEVTHHMRSERVQ